MKVWLSSVRQALGCAADAIAAAAALVKAELAAAAPMPARLQALPPPTRQLTRALGDATLALHELAGHSRERLSRTDAKLDGGSQVGPGN